MKQALLLIRYHRRVLRIASSVHGRAFPPPSGGLRWGDDAPARFVSAPFLGGLSFFPTMAMANVKGKGMLSQILGTGSHRRVTHYRSSARMTHHERRQRKTVVDLDEAPERECLTTQLDNAVLAGVKHRDSVSAPNRPSSPRLSCSHERSSISSVVPAMWLSSLRRTLRPALAPAQVVAHRCFSKRGCRVPRAPRRGGWPSTRLRAGSSRKLPRSVCR